MTIKYTLKNGLTILVKPLSNIPKVSTQLWYNVGSKDEKNSEKGIAHLIEHMIFKGTTTLSECDINMITHKLSGTTNAFTSYDYTGYLFDFPSQNWHEALPILADCMRNCTFKEDFLTSELKAVIQELKMYKDNYISSITENLLSQMFYDHPYHHPIIGYKQDLWNLNRDNLVNFYEHHYIPNNATLVVVGDVHPEEVYKLAEKHFGQIKPNWDYKKDEYYHTSDLAGSSSQIYREVNQPQVVLSWVVPGVSANKDYVLELLCSVLASGKSSRLYKKLINELELVVEIDAFTYDLFEYGVFLIYFEPKNSSDIDKITEIIYSEIEKITKNIPEDELFRAIKSTEVSYLDGLENHQKIAYNIGKYFLATGDHQYFDNYLKYPKAHLEKELTTIIDQYLRPSLTHIGKILPIKEQDKKYWLSVQELSDQEDSKILSIRQRHIEVESPKCAALIKVNQPKSFNFLKAKKLYLSNGLKVLYGNNDNLPKIDMLLDFKVKHTYDPEDKLGLCSFVFDMLLEGTKNYTADELADILESYGISIETGSGHIYIGTLSVDLTKGLELLNEILTQALFDEKAIEKVRAQKIADIRMEQDDAGQIANRILMEQIYKSHPYHKRALGTIETIKNITRDDLVNFYKKYISPKAATLSIVGDLTQYEIKKVLEHMLNTWSGEEIELLQFPKLSPVKHEVINHPLMRDQVFLAFGGLSVSRINPNYDKLLLFDQIFTGGLLGSMSSRLFDLRERSGLFYTIGGSLVAGAYKEPGIIYIKTIVSNDRLQEAEKEISKTINTAIDTISESEFEEAKMAVINSLVDNFAANKKIASVFLAKELYEFPDDYFDHRAEQLSKVTIQEMQDSVRKYLNTNNMLIVRVGRV